jgi:hypothetical protein
MFSLLRWENTQASLPTGFAWLLFLHALGASPAAPYPSRIPATLPWEGQGTISLPRAFSLHAWEHVTLFFAKEKKAFLGGQAGQGISLRSKNPRDRSKAISGATVKDLASAGELG